MDGKSYFLKISEEEYRQALFEAAEKDLPFYLVRKGIEVVKERFFTFQQELKKTKSFFFTGKTGDEFSLKERLTLYFKRDERIFVARVDFFGHEKQSSEEKKDLFIVECRLTDQFFVIEQRKSFRLFREEEESLFAYFPLMDKKSSHFLSVKGVDEEMEDDPYFFVNFIKNLKEEKNNNLSPVFVYPLRDFNAFGLSFYIKDYERPLFKMNQTINDLFLVLDKKEFFISESIVRRIVEDKLHTLVALEFLNITEDMEHSITGELNIILKKRKKG